MYPEYVPKFRCDVDELGWSVMDPTYRHGIV